LTKAEYPLASGGRILNEVALITTRKESTDPEGAVANEIIDTTHVATITLVMRDKRHHPTTWLHEREDEIGSIWTVTNDERHMLSPFVHAVYPTVMGPLRQTKIPKFPPFVNPSHSTIPAPSVNLDQQFYEPNYTKYPYFYRRIDPRWRRFGNGKR
jgi:hypothetical protein